ncbi:MAG: HNH endonuclease signature motif containing protein [Acidimicrobiales bacterium]
MRDPRTGIVWSQSRVRRRSLYGTYMDSPVWWATRKWWAETYLQVFGHEPTCAACGTEWTLRHDDLHHRSYERLGHERFGDVISLCRPCHSEMHRRLESSVSLRRLGRTMATDLIVRRMTLEQTVARAG